MVKLTLLKRIILLVSLISLAPAVWAQKINLRQQGLQAYQAKSYAKAALSFYQWSRQTKLDTEKQEAKYYLGISLGKLNLLQIGSFPLIDVVRSGNAKFRKQALNQLAFYATQLDEKALLKFTLNKLAPEDLTDVSKSVFYLSLSEIADEQNQIDKASQYAQLSLTASAKNDEALYQLASLSLQQSNFKDAIAYFSQLLEKYKDRSPADKKRGLLNINIARVYYQMKDWSKAIDYYRQVPKDHADYRTALQELSWSLLRAGQLRSALSPLQTLLSPFYSQFFDPETLIISSSIYIFSCQFQDAIAATETFDKNYTSTLGQLELWLKGQRTPDDFYAELARAQRALENLSQTGEVTSEGQLPFFILRSIIAEADVQAGLKYLKRLEFEQKKVRQDFAGSTFLSFAEKILKGRRIAAKKQLAVSVENYLKAYFTKTSEMTTQISFIKYEALNGLRAELKDKAYGNTKTIESDVSRDYYAQNGYRYSPSKGQ